MQTKESKGDCYYEPITSPTPKLSLYSFPTKLNESPGMATPPIHTLASVPFQWEEAPGKPRPSSTQSYDKPKSARCLDLPPRLLVEAKVVNFPSPTTVLEGPYMGRSSSVGKGSMAFKEKSIFGSFRKQKKEVAEGGLVDDGYSGDGVGGTKVKITRIKRRSSFMGFSNKRSHLWANIYDSVKQVVQWRRRREKSSQSEY